MPCPQSSCAADPAHEALPSDATQYYLHLLVMSYNAQIISAVLLWVFSPRRDELVQTSGRLELIPSLRLHRIPAVSSSDTLSSSDMWTSRRAKASKRGRACSVIE